MKFKKLENEKTIGGIFVLILGIALTLGLFLCKYFDILYLDLETVLAPFVVILLLTYGDKLLILSVTMPISFATKLINKVKGFSQTQQQ